jgi:TonB-linked SusC/RagA family outer membrane protein
MLISIINLQAQKQTVSGTVTSIEDGAPLPGVSVMVEGASSGAVTDDNGRYSLSIPDGKAKIIFSYTGFILQTIDVNKRSAINVSLSRGSNQLSDVVVIGYGTRSKRDVTTAISTLDAGRISKTVASSPELLMQGQMSGVQVIGNNGDPNVRPVVRIRGTNTWGITDPLYVIDGIPIKEYGAGVEALTLVGQYNRGPINIMAMIDPNDIESISVLKDASAGAIYGVRAANGVILITTKRGKSGKPSVNYSQRNGIKNVVKRLDLLNTKQYADFTNALYASDPASIGSRNGDNYVFDPADPRYLGNSPTYDWFEAVRNKNAVSQDYSVNVSGMSDKTDYFVSFGYSGNEGVNISNYLKRYNGTIKLNIKINDYLRAGVNYRFSTVRGKDFSISPVDIAQMPPWQPIYDPNGTNGYANAVSGYDANGIWTAQKLYGSATNQNRPGYYSLSNGINSSLRHMGTAYVELEPIKALKIRGSINIDKFDNGNVRNNPYVASYLSIDGGDPAARAGGASLGDIENHRIDNRNIIYELSANYTKSIGNHNFDILFNAMNQDFKAENLNAYTVYTTSTDPNIIAFGGDNQYSSVVSLRNLNKLQGFLLRADYNYAHKYLLDLTVRRDGSSRFAPAKRWGTFPGISAGWRVSQENFMKDIKWINDLKLRAGWGTLGNEEVKDLAYLSVINQQPMYAFGNNPANIGRGYPNSSATIFGMPNADLTWEKTSTINVGFDAQLFNGLSFSAEYYKKNTDGILQTLSLPPSVGLIEQPVGNVAKVQNSGIELNANYSRQIGKLNFSVGANFTTVHNEVLKLYGGIPIGTIEEGYPLFYIKGFQIDGQFQTDAEVADWLATHNDLNYQTPNVRAGDFHFKDLRGAPGPGDKLFSNKPDGIIDDYDQVYLGKTIPGYYYGFNFSLESRHFDFSAQFTGVGDVQKVNNVKISLLNLDQEAANHTTDALNYWTPTNKNTNLPRLIWDDPAQNGRFSNFYVEDAAYLRLANTQLGYTLPDIGIKNILSNLRIYVGCSNLFTITKFKGFDPEDENNPAPLILYAGVNVKF